MSHLNFTITIKDANPTPKMLIKNSKHLYDNIYVINFLYIHKLP